MTIKCWMTIKKHIHFLNEKKVWLTCVGKRVSAFLYEFEDLVILKRVSLCIVKLNKV